MEKLQGTGPNKTANFTASNLLLKTANGKSFEF
jgi:hypothetical protein